MNAYERFVVAHHFSCFPEELSYDEIQALLKGDLDNDYDWCLWEVYEDYTKDYVIDCMDAMLVSAKHCFIPRDTRGMEEGSY